jgi:dTDP-4-dehydrorhamnose reductase
MLGLAKDRDETSVVSDQIGSPTKDADLAKAILTILHKIKNKNVELFHYTKQGSCSWYDYAVAIYKIRGKKIKIKPINTSDYETKAERPMYSVLNKTKITEMYGVNIPQWKTSLLKNLNRD